MKTFFGSDITQGHRNAEHDAKLCVMDAMEETGLPETAFKIDIEHLPDKPHVFVWSVNLASEK